MTVKTIDITPTWTEILPALVMLVKNGGTAKNAGIDELYKMAKLADLYVQHLKGETK